MGKKKKRGREGQRRPVPPQNRMQPPQRTQRRQMPNQPQQLQPQKRYKQRRAASERAKRRRRALLVFYLITLLVVISAAVVLSLTVLFQIDSIQVTGQSRYTEQEIVAACGIQKADNLFLSDTEKAKSGIEKDLPYIGDAKVSRRLPARILIEVKEATISGALEYQNKYLIISSTGKALELADAAPSNCPIIYGLKLDSAELGKKVSYQELATKKHFNELTSALEENGMRKVTKIDLTDPYQIRLEYDGRIVINFGLPSDFDYKVRFAQKVLGEDGMDKEKGTLNLSSVAEDDRAYFDQGEVPILGSSGQNVEPSSSAPAASNKNASLSPTSSEMPAT